MNVILMQKMSKTMTLMLKNSFSKKIQLLSTLKHLRRTRDKARQKLVVRMKMVNMSLVQKVQDFINPFNILI
uniref:Uncharacterized protein n=1 Tax=Cyanistes caeruleus TaxID=156563 RepID=A0A8C0U560_CYACU